MAEREGDRSRKQKLQPTALEILDFRQQKQKGTDSLLVGNNKNRMIIGLHHHLLCLLFLAAAAVVAPNAVSAFSTTAPTTGTQRARALVENLVNDERCFLTDAGARAFADACAANAVYEDCFMPQPITGPTAIREHMLFKVGQRKGKEDAGFRIDMISDGDVACGFAWTWTCGDEEGLRGTTFVELNDAGEIQFVREIPEPLFKPGDATKELLQAVTAGIEPTPKPEFESQTPTTASGIARYLYEEVQGGSVDEAMRFFSPDIEYRDFNYEEMLNGKDEVRKFIEDFSFPGITFRPQRFDDGNECTCFIWEVVIADAPETIKGMSLYRIDPVTRLINYVRDVPESAIKPPILGKLARDLRPGLGVFKGVKLGSRPGGK